MTTNETRRRVMLMAWGMFRADPVQTFAACLRGAWKLAKAPASRFAKRIAAARANGGRVECGSLVTVASYGFRSGTIGHRETGKTTSRMGC